MSPHKLEGGRYLSSQGMATKLIYAGTRVTSYFYLELFLIIGYMYLYVFVCDYLSLCVFNLGYFSHLASKGKLVILLGRLF